MKAYDIINTVDALKPNMFELEDKLNWLYRLDCRIKEEILDTHTLNEGESVEELAGKSYTRDTELLVGEPYTELYLHWLEAQIDYYNMEIEHFNDSNAMFEAVYSKYRNAYNRSHEPLGERKHYF